MHHTYSKVKRLTTSGAVSANPCFIYAILIGTDGSNDPVVALYNDTDANTAANRVFPSNTYDASALGVNGAVFGDNPIYCATACYCSISNIGTGEVIILYRDKDDVPLSVF